MNLTFKEIRYKNILSAGNTFTVLPLNESKTTLVVGTNGSGKSTMLDAMTLCLFGKSFRKLTKQRLVNSRNGKNLLVEMDFSVGDTEFTIRRGIKPNILEIIKDGEILDKEATVADQQKVIETSIIKMNYKTFCQMVILGKTNYVAFMELSAEDRRKFIENLLDIEVFSRMNKILKERWIKDNKDKILEKEKERDITSANIKGLQEKKDAVSTIQENELKKLKGRALEEKKKLDGLKEEIEDLDEEIHKLKASIEHKKTIDLKYNKIKEIQADLKAKLKSAKQPVEFLTGNDICPTCNQDIDGSFKEDAIQHAEQRIKKIETDIDKSEEIYKDLYEKREAIKEVESQISDKESDRRDKSYSADLSKQNLLSIKKDVEEIKANDQFNDAEKLEEYEKKLLTVKEELVMLYEQKNIYSVSYEMLKDTGIKSHIVKQYVPLMNRVINAYLAEMDIFVNFEFDENFEESFQSQNREDYKYDNFSEGEKLRIDLALLFTWRDICKMRNPVSSNLLVMDEMDASADLECVTALHKIVSRSDGNIFIISHSDVTKDVFSGNDTLTFYKEKGFSRYTK